MTSLNLTHMLKQLEYIIERLGQIQLGVEDYDPDQLEAELSELYDQLGEYAAIVSEAATDYPSHGGAL